MILPPYTFHIPLEHDVLLQSPLVELRQIAPQLTGLFKYVPSRAIEERWYNDHVRCVFGGRVHKVRDSWMRVGLGCDIYIVYPSAPIRQEAPSPRQVIRFLGCVLSQAAR